MVTLIHYHKFEFMLIYEYTFLKCSRLLQWEAKNLQRRLDESEDNAQDDVTKLPDINCNLDLSEVLPGTLKFFNIGVIIDYFITNNNKQTIFVNGRKMAAKRYAQSVKMGIEDTGIMYSIKSSCFSSYSKSKLYTQQIILDKNNNCVMGATCTCVVGATPKTLCKHVACILFVLENYVVTGNQHNDYIMMNI